MADITLRFRLPNADDDPASFVDVLAEVGCEATLGIGRRGYIALVVDAATHDEAVAAIRPLVDQAIPGAVLIEG